MKNSIVNLMIALTLAAWVGSAHAEPEGEPTKKTFVIPGGKVAAAVRHRLTPSDFNFESVDVSNLILSASDVAIEVEQTDSSVALRSNELVRIRAKGRGAFDTPLDATFTVGGMTAKLVSDPAAAKLSKNGQVIVAAADVEVPLKVHVKPGANVWTRAKDVRTSPWTQMTFRMTAQTHESNLDLKVSARVELRESADETTVHLRFTKWTPLNPKQSLILDLDGKWLPDGNAIIRPLDAEVARVDIDLPFDIGDRTIRNPLKVALDKMIGREFEVARFNKKFQTKSSSAISMGSMPRPDDLRARSLFLGRFGHFMAAVTPEDLDRSRSGGGAGDEFPGLPENVSPEVARIAPLWSFDEESCYPAAAISPDGSINAGLPLGGSLTAGCRDVEQLATANTFARRVEVQVGGRRFAATVFTLFFERDQILAGTSLGHPCDWESIVVFETATPTSVEVTHAAFSAHGDFQLLDADSLPRRGGSICAVYYSGLVSTHSMRPATPREVDSGEWITPKIVEWDRMSEQLRTALEKADFGRAVFPLSDDRLWAALGECLPPGYPDIAGWRGEDAPTQDLQAFGPLLERLNASSTRLNDSSSVLEIDGHRVIRLKLEDREGSRVTDNFRVHPGSRGFRVLLTGVDPALIGELRFQQKTDIRLRPDPDSGPRFEAGHRVRLTEGSAVYLAERGRAWTTDLESSWPHATVWFLEEGLSHESLAAEVARSERGRD